MDMGSNLSRQSIERKGSVHHRARLICRCMGQCTLERSVQGGGVYTGSAKFLKFVFKIDQ